DRWVPQLSSKRPGVVDNGVTWDNAMALQEHLRLRQQYGARLLLSGNWSTFSESNFWVTVADVTFANSAGALMWCRSKGFDRDHCIAKIVSTTHPVAGSTAYN
ncbi:MAG: serine/threonine kinase PknH, partial [Mycobacterium sp.]|nr:serine/threonine kinase PknH [Mycobacterium sp.]